MTEFGDRLRELREAARMTQEELARESGLGDRTIRRLESGEQANPRLRTIRMLAGALNLSEDQLVGPAKQRPSKQRPSKQRPAVGPAAHPVAQLAGLAPALDDLALAVGHRWRREYEHQQLHDPFPLPVRWRRIEPAAADADLVGEFTGVGAYFRQVASGRLVVLGGPGTGKTMLAIRLVLDLLSGRGSLDPLPVLFSVGSWDPTAAKAKDWLGSQLAQDYPHLAATTGSGLTLAAVLVDHHAILPVLDGFDEIPAGLRRAAVAALNRTALPIVLTSRPDEYADAGLGLAGATVVELAPLDGEDVTNYLPAAIRRGAAGSPAVWRRVIGASASSKILGALDTPLMVCLARAAYSDAPDAEPTELLDERRFPDAAAIEQHLVAGYLPARYQAEPSRTFRPTERTDRHLRYLARHAQKLKTTHLAWWEIGTAISLWTRCVVIGVVAAVAIALLCALLTIPVAVAFGTGAPLTTIRLQAFNSIVNGFLAGPFIGLVYGLVRWNRPASLAPSRIRLRIGRHRPPGAVPPAELCNRVLGAFLAGLAFGAAPAFVSALTFDVPFGTVLGQTAAGGLVIAVAAAAATALVSWLAAPAEIDTAADVNSFLAANRSTALRQMLLCGLAGGVVLALGSIPLRSFVLERVRQVAPEVTTGGLLLPEPGYELVVGITGGICFALACGLTLTAWGQWLILGRLWLPLTGELPWNPIAFLDDAYDRGLLRQPGPTYQFRHSLLQTHLAPDGQ